MIRGALLVAAALALGALFVVGAAVQVPRLEADLSRRVEQRLADDGMVVEAAFSGQDGSLRCPAPLADPAAAVADAGYGSSENYNILEKNNIDAYVKFSNFDRSQKPSRKTTPTFLADAFDYNESSRELICPPGKAMTHLYDTIEKTSTGYKRTISNFKSNSCSTCPMKERCVKLGHEHREVAIDLDFRRYKKKATELLVSELGVQYRKKRPIDVEPVFGNIKNNHGFKRFKLRTKNKAEIEIGTVSYTHLTLPTIYSV